MAWFSQGSKIGVTNGFTSYEYLGRDKRETKLSAPCTIANLFHSGPQPDSSGQSSLPRLRRCIFLYLN